jgi:hypothetical protein
MKNPVMNSDDTSMYDDPTTPSSVRELLQAGRRANAGHGYDVERGLAKHLAAIAATAPVTQWVPAATIAKSGLPAWFGFVAMPLAAASVAGLLWLYSADRAAPATPEQAAPGVGAATSAPAPLETEAAGMRVPSPAAAPAAQPTDEADSRGDDSHGSSLERRRTSARANAAHNGARSARPAVAPTRVPNEGDLNGVAAVSGEHDATDAAGATGNKSDDVGSSTRSAAKETRVTLQPESKAAQRREAAQEAAEAVQPKATGSKEAAAKPAPPVIDEARLEREMQMLAVTQRVLSSDPERALRLSEQGEREFAGSMFSAERRQLGLLALVKLGRVDEARRAGRPFLAHYPKAPWSERLRRALATGVLE